MLRPLPKMALHLRRSLQVRHRRMTTQIAELCQAPKAASAQQAEKLERLAQAKTQMRIQHQAQPTTQVVEVLLNNNQAAQQHPVQAQVQQPPPPPVQVPGYALLQAHKSIGKSHQEVHKQEPKSHSMLLLPVVLVLVQLSKASA